MSTQVVTIVVVGCGDRGEVYSSYALVHPDRCKVVAAVDPRAHSRAKIVSAHGLAASSVYDDWQELLRPEVGQLAACALITLPDKLHKRAAIELTKRGYHILLEKPMATTLDDCRSITMACRAAPAQFNAVCHVLRYFAPCIKIKQLLDAGLVGNVVNINHTEPVGFWHFAHSFVRGNWHNEAESSFSLLAKCCHDIDLIVYWLNGKRVKRVSSFGSLQHFRAENAPPAASDNCFTCPSEPECAYSAKRLYLDEKMRPDGWPAAVVLNSELANVNRELSDADIESFMLNTSREEKRDYLAKCLTHESTKYGRCVYKMDNDVCDNQVVNMQFDDGSTVTLTMIAFRHVYIFSFESSAIN